MASVNKLKFLIGTESTAMKSTGIGQVYFAKDPNDDKYKLYYDDGTKLVPVVSNYADIAKLDGVDNEIATTYFGNVSVTESANQGDTWTFKDGTNNNRIQIVTNDEVNQVPTSTNNSYPLLFGNQHSWDTTINAPVRMNGYYSINAKTGLIEGVALDGGEWGYSGGCCFFPGTPILLSTTGLTKNIEDIKQGEIVLSYNKETDEFYEVIVNKLIINPDTFDIAVVTFEDGRQLEMNAYHPLLTQNGFHSLTNHNNYDTLVEGDYVRDAYLGWNKIINIERYVATQAITTYNLDIKNFEEDIDDDSEDTFIANGLIVHNASCPT